MLTTANTIRPTKRILGFDTRDLFKPDMTVEPYVMWPAREWPESGFPQSPEDYKTKIQLIDQGKIRENYEKTNYIALQLVGLKYKYYRLATWWLKIMIVVAFVGIFILAFIKWAYLLANC